LLLGTGGASQAVQYVLAERNIRCSVVSREKSKGDFTYEELSQDVIASHSLIINSSPVGMYPNVDAAPALPYEYLTPQHYLFDLVYNPTTTRFMECGARYGAQTLSGLDMLYAQAEAAWAIWNR
jgi:shikimate dehydrogenase